jgi:hypothetical protein
VFVQATGGVPFYLRSMLDTARGEYERWTGRHWQPARYRELVKGERVRFRSEDS